jgi:SAM-dependent methyltransferase
MKLNLGCGHERLTGYVNVDKFGEPEVRCDLEVFPWPWETGSVDEVRLHHVLEHLGATSEVYLSVMKELYRVCRADARLTITVPHPRHDDFLIDPTHVRPILAESFQLFSKQKCLDWKARGVSNTPLALYLNVDFEVERVSHTPDPLWLAQLQAGKIKTAELEVMSQQIFNVLKQTEVVLRVIKPAP